MHPELFEIPFIHATVKSYGLMIVLGLLAAVFVIRRLSDHIGLKNFNKDYITNGALYALITGIIGSRIFYILHYYSQFRGKGIISLFAIWEGGLEQLGVLLAVAVIFVYLIMLKLPVRRFLDIIGIGLMVALAFGRIGCFLNGCCYGKPSNVPWAVHFPYGSFSYRSQVYPNLERHRTAPYLNLPDEYYGNFDDTGRWIPADSASKFATDIHGNYVTQLKPRDMLTDQQKQDVTTGKYRALGVHPTQLYSSLKGLIIFVAMYLFWSRIGYGKTGLIPRYTFGKPGCTFALLLVLYPIGRFIMEAIRDDNPFEIGTLTISQLICMGLFALGLALFALFIAMRDDEITVNAKLAKARLESGQRNASKAR
jgi:phosphatidylglycerol:prolipoprotein diacylglycerol transferase